MKKFLECLLHCCFLLLAACQSPGTASDPGADAFFDYTQIDYYHLNIYGDQVTALFENRGHSVSDSLKRGLIVSDIPADIADTAFIERLGAFGYTKRKIPSSAFAAMNGIFAGNPQDSLAHACLPVYRDLFVFKKQGRIAGLAKICFDCGESRIYGARSGAVALSRHSDYAALETLLDNLK